MNRSTKVILFGAALFFAALWGGFYVYSLVDGTWAEVPSGITATVLACAGFVAVVIGLFLHREIDKEGDK